MHARSLSSEHGFRNGPQSLGTNGYMRLCELRGGHQKSYIHIYTHIYIYMYMALDRSAADILAKNLISSPVLL